MKNCYCQSCERTRKLVHLLKTDKKKAYSMYAHEIPDHINLVRRSTISGEDFVKRYHSHGAGK